MTSTTFFIIFIPILSVLLLLINLVLAPHNPYQEKDSVFECGFHSFLGQNRAQFKVLHYGFTYVFLTLDLEIVLMTPYCASAYHNDISGLAMMMVFFVVLTSGFVFELGKNALSIDSKQNLSYKNEETPAVFIIKFKSPVDHVGFSCTLKSEILFLQFIRVFLNFWLLKAHVESPLGGSISDVYTMLVSILGEYFAPIFKVLFLVLSFLMNLLLIIRRANNSIGLYDRFFNFVANHKASIMIYSLILLISGVVVYCMGDFVVYYSYGCSISCDGPRAWGLYHLDLSILQVEELVELHDIVIYYLLSFLLAVAWIHITITRKFESSKSPISNKYLNGLGIDFFCKITPALILVLIAFPSFNLLYTMDEVRDPSLSVLVDEHRWDWSRQYLGAEAGIDASFAHPSSRNNDPHYSPWVEEPNRPRSFTAEVSRVDMIDFDQISIRDSVVELEKMYGEARKVSEELIAVIQETQSDIREAVLHPTKLVLDPSVMSGLEDLRTKLDGMKALGDRARSTICSDNHQFIYDLCDLCNKEMRFVKSLHRAMPDSPILKELTKAILNINKDVKTVANNIRILEERITERQNDLLYKNGSYGVRPNSGDISPSNRMTSYQRKVFWQKVWDTAHR